MTMQTVSPVMGHAMFRKFWNRLDLALKIIMAVSLFTMMLLTAADVVARYFLNAPISGAFEIVQYLMAIVVFAALPVTTSEDRHLTVSLMPNLANGLFDWLHRVFVRLISLLALFVIAWRMAVQAEVLSQSQQVSGYLQLPLAPISAAMAAFAALACLIVTTKLVAAVFRLDASVRSFETERRA